MLSCHCGRENKRYHQQQQLLKGRGTCLRNICQHPAPVCREEPLAGLGAPFWEGAGGETSREPRQLREVAAGLAVTTLGWTLRPEPQRTRAEEEVWPSQEVVLTGRPIPLAKANLSQQPALSNPSATDREPTATALKASGSAVLGEGQKLHHHGLGCSSIFFML